ncbi:mCG1048373 [Mus musculus]|nr:mCG1048373 [Mus musculus]
MMTLQFTPQARSIKLPPGRPGATLENQVCLQTPEQTQVRPETSKANIHRKYMMGQTWKLEERQEHVVL